MSDNKENETVSKKEMSQGLLNSRSVIISGEINQEVAKEVITQLLILQEMGDTPIKLYLNSQGGHVEAADSIHDMIKFISPEVIIIGTGWVASAGITILLAAEKKNRIALPNTRFMIHQPLGGVNGQATDVEIEARQIIKMLERINLLISNATGQSVEKVKNDTDRNFWMDTREAIDYGIISRVITSHTEIA
ncbi:ATP-dependent Clp protease proteolytic subunit [Rahnella sp. AA]|uniref:ATP-dependent Clp protease proteolytic subunit n=1 Tax=Rahnella sp. AA TaxID=2057180 RepID=UPI000C34FD8F|nr:ATP-dependent Clp protease proteolytic subunit [Rahnella sp. AA]PKE28904.1 ATP-dependent Clp protease proteolytic subunit [Rahnella sp. AA]